MRLLTKFPAGLHRLLQSRAGQTSRTVSGWDSRDKKPLGGRQNENPCCIPDPSLTWSKGICHWGRVWNPHHALLCLQSLGSLETVGGEQNPLGKILKVCLKTNKTKKANEQNSAPTRVLYWQQAKCICYQRKGRKPDCSGSCTGTRLLMLRFERKKSQFNDLSFQGRNQKMKSKLSLSSKGRK